MEKSHQAVLNFAVNYSGWHSVDPRCLDMINSIQYLKNLGLLEIRQLNEFRAIEK